MTNHIQSGAAGQRLDLEIAYEAARAELKRALVKTPPSFSSLTNHLARSDGKNIRAYSLLSCAMGKDLKVDSDAAAAAAAIELLHLATLVHDDVIDDSPTRRGKETLQKKFGKRSAVICGDYLMCLSLQTAFRVGLPLDELAGALPQYMSRVCLGEMRQNVNNRNFNLTLLDYLRIISGKTAALFEACFYIGFLLSGEDSEEKRKYMRLGHVIGLIFQLADDCIDYESSEDLAKKPVKTDFEQGVVTLPLIYALEANATLRQKVTDPGACADEVSGMVVSSGGVAFARNIIKRYYNKAAGLILSINTSAEKKEALRAILDRATGLAAKTDGVRTGGVGGKGQRISGGRRS